MSPHLSAAPEPSVRVRAPGKVNLSLRVGALQDDGYHPLVTIFQAVTLGEEVVARQVPDGAGTSLVVSGLHADGVPVDRTNLAWRAAEALAAHVGVAPDVRLEIDKEVPVAGGMAGGSADAAAALVACDALWGTGVPRTELLEIAAGLGADVAFGLVGHTAVGTGRGDSLTPAMVRGEFHWAFAAQAEGLSTPAVYRAFDESGAAPASLEPAADTALMQALRAGDPFGVGRELYNDLQAPAISLRPELQRTIDLALDAGALGAIVSGSGPTVAALARSRQHALAIGAHWTAAGACAGVYCTTAPAPGARILTLPA